MENKEDWLKDYLEKQKDKISEKEYRMLEEALTKLRDGKSVIEATGINKECLEYYYSIACEKYAVGDCESAKSLFTKLNFVDPSDFRFVHGLARCFYWIKEYEKAIDLYQNYKLINQDNPKVYYHLALCYNQLGKHNDELAELQKCLSLAPKNTPEQLLFYEDIKTLISFLINYKI